MRREGGKDIADGRNGMKGPVELRGQAGGQPFPKWGQETGSCHQLSLESLHSPLTGPQGTGVGKPLRSPAGRRPVRSASLPGT